MVLHQIKFDQSIQEQNNRCLTNNAHLFVLTLTSSTSLMARLPVFELGRFNFDLDSTESDATYDFIFQREQQKIIQLETKTFSKQLQVLHILNIYIFICLLCCVACL